MDIYYASGVINRVQTAEGCTLSNVRMHTTFHVLQNNQS